MYTASILTLKGERRVNARHHISPLGFLLPLALDIPRGHDHHTPNEDQEQQEEKQEKSTDHMDWISHNINKRPRQRKRKRWEAAVVLVRHGINSPHVIETGAKAVPRTKTRGIRRTGAPGAVERKLECMLGLSWYKT